ncbi:uncharacterized protein LOC118985838 [Sturnira hondurensis]|uniref:uncharacterized protein LOC118985838 n=1 Tax=Sturnira hondurensis TaxID=192404 RepID=UPI0018795D30|nr:uncharacterized protein LOC118985838 [Sturnira hondurensis]
MPKDVFRQKHPKRCALPSRGPQSSGNWRKWSPETGEKPTGTFATLRPTGTPTHSRNSESCPEEGRGGAQAAPEARPAAHLGRGAAPPLLTTPRAGRRGVRCLFPGPRPDAESTGLQRRRAGSWARRGLCWQAAEEGGPETGVSGSLPSQPSRQVPGDRWGARGRRVFQEAPRGEPLRGVRRGWPLPLWVRKTLTPCPFTALRRRSLTEIPSPRCTSGTQLRASPSWCALGRSIAVLRASAVISACRHLLEAQASPEAAPLPSRRGRARPHFDFLNLPTEGWTWGRKGDLK